MHDSPHLTCHLQYKTHPLLQGPIKIRAAGGAASLALVRGAGVALQLEPKAEGQNKQNGRVARTATSKAQKRHTTLHPNEKTS